MFDFNVNMNNISISEEYLSLEVTDNITSFEISWSSTYINAKQMKVSYATTPELLGGEKIVVTVEEPQMFISTSSLTLESSQSFIIDVVKEEPAPSFTTSVQSAGYMLILNFAVSTAANILTGGSLEMMWSMANTLQIIFFLGLLDLHYPKHTTIAFFYMSYANFDNPVLGMVTRSIVGEGYFVENPLNDNFDEFGYESRNIVSNAHDILPIIVGFIFLCFVVVLTRLCTQYSDKWV